MCNPSRLRGSEVERKGWKAGAKKWACYEWIEGVEGCLLLRAVICDFEWELEERMLLGKLCMFGY